MVDEFDNNEPESEFEEFLFASYDPEDIDSLAEAIIKFADDWAIGITRNGDFDTVAEHIRNDIGVWDLVKNEIDEEYKIRLIEYIPELDDDVYSDGMNDMDDF